MAFLHRAPAQASAPIVYVIAIEGIIDLGLAPFLSRTISEVHAAGAAAVLLDINTSGGRVDAAVAMRGRIGGPVHRVRDPDYCDTRGRQPDCRPASAGRARTRHMTELDPTAIAAIGLLIPAVVLLLVVLYLVPLPPWIAE